MIRDSLCVLACTAALLGSSDAGEATRVRTPQVRVRPVAWLPAWPWDRPWTDGQQTDVFALSLGDPIPPSCPQFPALNGPGVLCEDFETNRNGLAGFQWTRLPIGADPNNPLRAIGDPNDDVLGYTINGGPSPLGTDARTCLDDASGGHVGCQDAVSSENDWHLHSPFEGPGAAYDPPNRPGIGAPGGGKAHSGVRSMHWGRHTDPLSTLGDATRFRQVSAFVLDSQGDPNLPGIVPGPATSLEFWHMISLPDDENFGSGFIPPGRTFGGGQVQISLVDSSGKFGRWQRLSPTFNGYDSAIQDSVSLCGFDPGDDQISPADESICESGPVWSDLGDIIGTDATCVTDTDFNDPAHKDCGAISSCAGGPGCTENGSIGTGVWARSAFDLSPFASRVARLRWIGMMEGGWSFGLSRSVLEPDPGGFYQMFDGDDGWSIDDIKLTDLRVAPAPCVPDADGDGVTVCDGDCDDGNPTVYPRAPQLCGGGLNNDCLDPAWPALTGTNEVDDDGDTLTECQGDCDDTHATVYPGAPQLCDGLNNDCGNPSWPAAPANEANADFDAFRICQGDCDDAHATVYPGAPRICGDGLNNDCNDPHWPASAPTEANDDGDGFKICAGDCDDTRATVYPGAPQICDGLNNNCNSPSWPALTGTNDGDDDGDALTECAGDCDDARSTVYPGAPQICDGLNNDCSAPGWPAVPANEANGDGDAFRICQGDCDDTRANVYPGAFQLCDGINNDCSAPGWPVVPANEANSDGDAYRICQGDCDDTRATIYRGAPQICDGLNNNCEHPEWPLTDGTNEFDDDGDGFSECQNDCDDGSADSSPPSEARELVFSSDGVTMTWLPPLFPNGPALVYDLIRASEYASDFVVFASCLESDGTDTQAADPEYASPGGIFYYLVRAQNGCGGGFVSTGSSGGAPLPARSCPP